MGAYISTVSVVCPAHTSYVYRNTTDIILLRMSFCHMQQHLQQAQQQLLEFVTSQVKQVN